MCGGRNRVDPPHLDDSRQHSARASAPARRASCHDGTVRGGQVIRQWIVLRVLERARRGVTVAELLDASEGRASRRTLYRDLEQLRQAGFPICEEDGRWQLRGAVEGAWTVPVDPSMVLALMLSEEVMRPLRDTELAEPLQELRARLLALLTPVGRAYVDELRKTSIATTFGAPAYHAVRSVVVAVQEAIAKQQRLRLRYSRPGGSTRSRVVEPYFTWVAGGRLYLVGRDTDLAGVRTFAVQRITQAEILDEPFEPDLTFDPSEFVSRGFGVYHGDVHRFVIDFAPEVAYVVRERPVHGTQQVEDRDGGWVRLTMDAAGLPEVAAWVASFGGRVRPIAPRALVDAVRRIHEDGLSDLRRGGPRT